MNTEQIRELVLRKHNSNGGFTQEEGILIARWVDKTYNHPTEEELKLHDKIEALYPDLWQTIIGVRGVRRDKPAPKFSDNSPLLNAKPSLLVKLGSLVIHYEEWTSNMGHPHDKQAIDSIMNDEEVVQWFKAMKELALLPVKR